MEINENYEGNCSTGMEGLGSGASDINTKETKKYTIEDLQLFAEKYSLDNYGVELLKSMVSRGNSTILDERLLNVPSFNPEKVREKLRQRINPNLENAGLADMPIDAAAIAAIANLFGAENSFSKTNNSQRTLDKQGVDDLLNDNAPICSISLYKIKKDKSRDIVFYNIKKYSTWDYRYNGGQNRKIHNSTIISKINSVAEAIENKYHIFKGDINTFYCSNKTIEILQEVFEWDTEKEPTQVQSEFIQKMLDFFNVKSGSYEKDKGDSIIEYVNIQKGFHVYSDCRLPEEYIIMGNKTGGKFTFYGAIKVQSLPKTAKMRKIAGIPSIFRMEENIKKIKYLVQRYGERLEDKFRLNCDINGKDVYIDYAFYSDGEKPLIVKYSSTSTAKNINDIEEEDLQAIVDCLTLTYAPKKNPNKKAAGFNKIK